MTVFSSHSDEFREMLALEKENRRLLRHIFRHLQLPRFTILVTQENAMAITLGTTGTFAAQLEDNGNPIPLPSGSTFSWSTDDTNATVTPSADTTSAVVSISAVDTVTQVTVTASTTAPDGSTVSGSVSVPVIPGVAHTYTVTVTQSA